MENSFSTEEVFALRERQYYVTGASGYLGREICRCLCEAGCRVHGLAGHIREGDVWPEGLQVMQGDLLQLDSLRSWLAESTPGDALIHVAGYISVKRRNPRCWRVNLEGTENVLTVFQERGMGKLLYLGSVDALPPQRKGAVVREPVDFDPALPHTDYGRSKAAAAQKMLVSANNGENTVILLPSAVAGPGDTRQGFITLMINLCLHCGFRVGLSGGYSFVDVRDTAEAVCRAVLYAKGGSVYLLSGEYVTITDIFNQISAITGKKGVVCTLPTGILYPVLPFISLYYGLRRKEPPLSAAAIRLLQNPPLYDCNRAKAEIGFRPRAISDTLRDEVAYLEEKNQKK